MPCRASSSPPTPYNFTLAQRRASSGKKVRACSSPDFSPATKRQLGKLHRNVLECCHGLQGRVHQMNSVKTVLQTDDRGPAFKNGFVEVPMLEQKVVALGIR